MRLEEFLAGVVRSLEQQIQELLKLGCERFQLPIGMVTRVRGEELEIEQVEAPPGAGLHQGARLSIVKTFCQQALKSGAAVAIEHAGATEWRHHPGYASGLEAYLGARVNGAEQSYGTLCFGDVQPYRGRFTPADRDLLQRLAWWIGAELDRRQAERDTRHVQSLVTAIVENLPQLVFVKDARDLRYVLINKATEELLGRPRAAVIGKLDTQLFPAAAAAQLNATDRRVMSSGNLVEDSEETVSGVGPGTRTFRTRRIVIRGADGTPHHVLGIADDITQRKRHELEVRQAQKMQAIGTLAGGIAHDFNNILTVIMGFSEMAQDGVPKDGIAAENLRQVLLAGTRAKKLVQQILAFSRQQEEARAPLRLGGLLREAQTLLRAALPTTIEMDLCVGTEDPLVLADPTQIQQLLLNLCSNAGYAMRERGGCLTLRLEPVAVTEEFAAHHPPLRPGPHVRLAVSDTGCGIPPELLDRIFDPFFTTKPVGEGTGLGLSVAHGIVAAHEGVITVASEMDKGTTFEVHLPVMRDEQVAPDSVPGDLQGSGRVLFVDDEPMLVAWGEQILTRLGYDVVAVNDPVHALELFRATPERFDIVITDQVMPRMTGEALARELLQTRPEIPIVLYTGFIRTMTPERARRLGIRACLTKPVVMAELAVTLRQILTQAAARDRAEQNRSGCHGTHPDHRR
ncbi:MAG: ATP-binding protein [Planctomycetota bacterium]